MNEILTSFKRYEKKYLLSEGQCDEFLMFFRDRLETDGYGLYTVQSIYYDTDDYLLARRSIEKPVYKEKLRLRSYGVPTGADDTVFLEIKKKFKGVVYKRRSALPLARALDCLENGAAGDDIDSEITRFIGSYRLRPKALIAYDRIAMVYSCDPRIRMTIDRNIRWRSDRLDLLAGDLGKPLTGRGDALLEIKTPDAIPLDIARKLSQLGAFPTSFSKYGSCYQKELIYDFESGLRTGGDRRVLQMAGLRPAYAQTI